MTEEFDPKVYLQQGAWRDVRLGLHRTEELLERLGRPQDSLRIVHGVQRPGFFLTGVGVCLSIADAVACDLPRHGHERRISPTCSPTGYDSWGTGGGFLVPCVLRMVFKNNRLVCWMVRNHWDIPAAKAHTRR